MPKKKKKKKKKRRNRLASPHLSSDVAHLQHQVLKTDKKCCSGVLRLYSGLPVWCLQVIRRVFCCSEELGDYATLLDLRILTYPFFLLYSYSRLGMRSTGFLGYYDALVFWSYGLLAIPLFTTRPFFFFSSLLILVTLISRSPSCSSSESGSQARQECKSCSGYLFLSNAILLVFEITLESLCNHHKNGPPVFLAYALILLVWCLQVLRRIFCCPEKN
ncbi:hypothetical protein BD560DRAFT_95856 [Blakeslea trispora]|nr:hypothetical protein BD560DRAFT_95856 [Blakeslea trispora]